MSVYMSRITDLGASATIKSVLSDIQEAQTAPHRTRSGFVGGFEIPRQNGRRQPNCSVDFDHRQTW